MTLDRIKTFSKSQQFLILGSEFERARVWQDKDREKFRMALSRALELIDLILKDPKWEAQAHLIEFLREEVLKFYTEENKGSVAVLYQAL